MRKTYSLTLDSDQWHAISKLLNRQHKLYEAHLSNDISEEEYHGVEYFRRAVCNLSNEIAAAKKKA